MFRISGSIKFWDPSWGLSNTGGPSPFTVTMEYLFAFQFWLCKLCVEIRWGGSKGAQNIVLLIFVLRRCFNRWWVRGCGVGQKVLFRACWYRIFFQPGFKRTQYAWCILACFIDWIFLRFIFMRHCCFRFSSLRNV